MHSYFDNRNAIDLRISLSQSSLSDFVFGGSTIYVEYCNMEELKSIVVWEIWKIVSLLRSRSISKSKSVRSMKNKF